MWASRGLGAATGALVLLAGACGGGSASTAPSGKATTGPAATRSTPSSPATPRAGEEWLAYQDSSFRIRLVRPDGTDDHALDTVTMGAEDNPDWSPDGTRLTFVGTGDKAEGNAGLWVIGADGTGLTELVHCSAPCQNLDDPAWSPDGSHIMFGRMEPGAGQEGSLQAVDVRSRALTTVLTAKPGDGFAGVRYSPDGASVVLEWVHATPADHDDVKGVTLARVELTTSPPRVTRLTADALFAETADWSPKGDLIVYAAFAKPGGSATDLFLVRPDGSGARRLTSLADAGSGALYPDFTNDASAVVFLGADDSGRPRFRVIQLATGTVSPAFGLAAGVHPRSRPVP